jgi:2'-5' RNA ligase
VRLFVATTFPVDVLVDVNERVARMRSRLPPAAWVRPESQHLTFAFLGEHDAAVADSVGEGIEEGLAQLPAFETRLQGSGFFPNSRHPRVGWIGVTPAERFQEIADAVRTKVRAAGVSLDGADFKAHLTLCRIRDHWPPASIEVFQSAFAKFESAPFIMGTVTLFASELRPTGAIHTPLREFRLPRNRVD